MATSTTGTAQQTHIDETIEAIDDHVKKESTSAITSVSSWLKKLEGHEEFSGIATDLEALKAAMQDKDGARIAELMEKLGKATTEAGEGAGAEGKGVKALGKALSAAAKAIAKLA